MIGAGCLGATTNPPVTSVWLPPNALKTNPNAFREKGGGSHRLPWVPQGRGWGCHRKAKMLARAARGKANSWGTKVQTPGENRLVGAQLPANPNRLISSAQFAADSTYS